MSLETTMYNMIVKQRKYLINKNKKKILKYENKLGKLYWFRSYLEDDLHKLKTKGNLNDYENVNIEENIINIYPNGLPHGYNKGYLTYVMIVQDKIKWDQKNILIFNDIQEPTISFCKGFTEPIFKNIRQDEFDKYFEVRGTEKFVNKFKKSIRY